jgi:DNA repair protein RAD50
MIKELHLRGIRSFSSESEAVIAFNPNLTLIYGHNGAGKTTIIESLRVATTGSYPPNSESGKAFIHDPKFV